MGAIGSAVLTFIKYKQTDKHPNRHPDKLNLYIDITSSSADVILFQISEIAGGLDKLNMGYEGRGKGGKGLGKGGAKRHRKVRSIHITTLGVYIFSTIFLLCEINFPPQVLYVWIVKNK